MQTRVNKHFKNNRSDKLFIRPFIFPSTSRFSIKIYIFNFDKIFAFLPYPTSESHAELTEVNKRWEAFSE